MKNFRPCCHALVVGAVLLLFPTFSSAVSLTVKNLVTDDQAANPAQITDPGLVNAWGFSYSPTSPFWVSANGSGTSMIYRVDPTTQITTKQGLVVSIPGPDVTGQVFNNNASAFNGDPFLFVSEDGTVSGWRGALGTTAETLAIASSANVYKGAAIGNIAGNSYLYTANFKAISIDVFKGNAPGPPALSGGFTDPNLPAGYTPFNIQNLNGSLYVTYAATDGVSNDEIQGPGLGIVNKFDLEGNLLGRVATGGTLNAPWGLAIAPTSFEALAGALLVGNFGDGRINAFDPLTFAYLGQLLDPNNNPLVIDGLWAISPGNNGSAGSSDMLYFSAGPNDESHGVFGVLTAGPEPSTYALMLAGVLGLLIRRRPEEPRKGTSRTYC